MCHYLNCTPLVSGEEQLSLKPFVANAFVEGASRDAIVTLATSVLRQEMLAIDGEHRDGL